MPKVLEYLDSKNQSPYGRWFDGLSAEAAAKITAHKIRLAQGNMSNVEPVGKGVLEKRIDWGPGYRIYFAKDGDDLILLLGGGSKKRQQSDVEAAQERLQDYKKRKDEKKPKGKE